MAAWLLQCSLRHTLPSLKSSSVVLLLHLLAFAQVNAVIYERFEGSSDDVLQKMIRDESTGSIYVGSVNKLYKLSSNLSVELTKVVGPVQDNPECRPPPADCVSRWPTDNINKLLVVDEERNHLITCGSIYQGVCQALRLHNLSFVDDSIYVDENGIVRLAEVVSNTAQGTNVAFIAPGTAERGNVLYTAASFGNWIRTNVPTVAKRVLYSSEDRPMIFGYFGFRAIPGATFNDAAVEINFDINYMYGFSSGTFSYFIATQVVNFKDGESPIYTKIVRLCHEDDSEKLFSYIEMPLICKVNDTVYNLTQSAYVTKVGSDLLDAGIQPGEDVLFVTASSIDSPLKEKSAICMYSLRTVNEGFFKRIEDCAEGKEQTTTEMDWLAATSPCGRIQGTLDSVNASAANYCHRDETNSPLGGVNIAIEAQSIFTSDTTITAIAAIPHNEATVVLLGDDQGNLKKLRVKSATEAQLYEELTVTSGNPVVHNGLMFDAEKQYVYVMTEKNITKVPIETCETRTSCEECLLPVTGNVGDPHCGWCPLQTSCTRRSEEECSGSTEGLANRWIDQRDRCISVQSVTPASIPSDSTALLTLAVTSLPELSNNSYYECVFEGQHATRIEVKNVSTAGNVDSVVQCSTPSYEPTLEGGNLQVPLSIRASETGKLITNTTFDFYKCSAFDSCTTCVGDFMCNWCIFENRCMGNASTCNSSQVVAGKMVEDVQTAKRGKAFCPRINDDSHILIPAGTPVPFEFTVAVSSLPVQSGYECVLEHSAWKESVVTPAVKINDTIIRCSPRLYNYTMYESSVTVKFYIRWNNGLFVLDGSSSISVILYKCAVRRATCGSCLTADESFDCGWCVPSSTCTMRSQCPTDPSQGLVQRWLGSEGLCPDPKITVFRPKSGHIAGGTIVIIQGFNLGQEPADIRNVTVAGMPCMPVPSEYSQPERIGCVTDPSSVPASGPVKILIGRDNATTMTMSKEFFSFVEPRITSFRPNIGPKSGGTLVSLFGEHLDAGATRTITAVGKPCHIIGSTNLSNKVTCTTSDGAVGDKGLVVMTFDLDGMAMTRDNFTYKTDPTITDLSRTSTIFSGGIDLQVMGSDLTVVQEPKMVFHFGTRATRTKRQAVQAVTITTTCTTSSSTAMKCKSPNLNTPELADILVFNDNATLPSLTLKKSSFGFVMDGVPNLRSNLDLVVYADPEYFMFEEEGNLRQLEFGERRMLEIRGRYIAQTYMVGDVAIKVGEKDCEQVMMHKENLLTCEAPERDVGQFYDVVVYHGNLVLKVGRLEYLPEQLPLTIIIGAACGLALLLLGILTIVCICRRFSKNKRRLKKMELQRDQMEMRVAQECKDAFAELQITVLTVSSDVEGSGIPFRDYRDYAARVLFPDNPNHHVFREIPVSKENISGIKRDVLQKGLVQFGHLINNQTFLTIFIRTLEAQKTLTLKDLSNIASLLVIALHNKMDFLTEAMKNLLERHIKGYVKEGRPELLLRRSEAVVEKLVSHWVSLLMYDSLKDNMGKPLFHLFYAIKQQIDKGPVDAVTGEARYGLSEMKVIRQQIDFKTLNVFTNTLDITSEPIQLKVLDCDTISQTKDKILDAIYKSCPFSKRPTRDELDLEWSDRPQGSRSMILLDDDGRGLDGEWKRLNTLAHYGVHDGVTLRLVRAQPNGGSLPNSPARNYGLGTLQTSPATSASPIIDQEKGTIPWHLVKHVDSGSLRKGERDQKMMAEIYLPRLLTTKGILQTFVDELLETIFNCDKYDSDIPLAVKYIFDFLDAQATSHGVTNNDVVHAWKSNCLQLRFWVNLIMNPTILFDINKTDTVDACVSIIGQTLIDSCSVSEQLLTKDSPSNKLLYAKDIPNYKQWVARYYKDISEMAPISDQDMGAMLTAHTNRYQHEFQPLNALNELYFCYGCIYKSEILQALDEDKEAQKQNLGDKLEDIFRLMADSA